MSVATLAPPTFPDPEPPTGGGPLVSFAAYDALVRAALAALAADAGGYPNPLGYLRDALGTAPRPGAHPREYVPCDPGDALFGRW
jgi:hypothetical protein